MQALPCAYPPPDFRSPREAVHLRCHVVGSPRLDSRSAAGSSCTRAFRFFSLLAATPLPPPALVRAGSPGLKRLQTSAESYTPSLWILLAWGGSVSPLHLLGPRLARPKSMSFSDDLPISAARRRRAESAESEGGTEETSRAECLLFGGEEEVLWLQILRGEPGNKV